MNYYSLTFRNKSGIHYAGQRIYNACAPLTIGQLESCDIQLPCADDLYPQTFCIIIPRQDNNGWQLIPQSDFHCIEINGERTGFAHTLMEGDVISVGETSIQFHTHNDNNYAEGQGIVVAGRQYRKTMVFGWVLAVLAALAIVFGYQTFEKGRKAFTTHDSETITQSVYKIQVRQFMLQCHIPGEEAHTYRTVETYEPDSIPTGTCFFTTDSLCVTARHCVEPWIDYSHWDDDTRFATLPKEVRWAVMAEQSQLEQADTLYRLVTLCQVLDGDSCILEFTSDKCSFNRSRDIITNLGEELLPWRFVYPLFNCMDVELGDFAFLKTTTAGQLEMADNEYLKDISPDGNLAMRIYGFPKKNHGHLMEFQDASLAGLPRKEEGKYVECLRIKVKATNGYSGSPLIEKKDGRLKVIGILSKADCYDESKSTFYFVPINEVSHYNPQKANEQIR